MLLLPKPMPRRDLLKYTDHLQLASLQVEPYYLVYLIIGNHDRSLPFDSAAILLEGSIQEIELQG